jgi:hypothetical protein
MFYFAGLIMRVRHGCAASTHGKVPGPMTFQFQRPLGSKSKSDSYTIVLHR